MDGVTAPLVLVAHGSRDDKAHACVADIVDAVRTALPGVDVRLGYVDVRGDDVSGIAINIAARIMSQAVAGETLVSEAARLVSLGSHHRFEELRTTEHKGIPDRWTLHRSIP